MPQPDFRRVDVLTVPATREALGRDQDFSGGAGIRQRPHCRRSGGTTTAVVPRSAHGLDETLFVRLGLFRNAPRAPVALCHLAIQVEHTDSYK